MECGLHFNIRKDDFRKNENIKFSLFTPFHIYKKNLSVIYQDLLNDRNINLIFNEKCSCTIDYSTQEDLPYAKLIELGNGTKFLLVNSRLIENECDETKIVFNVGTKDLRLEDLFKDDSIKDVDFYVRFNFRVDLNLSKNIIRGRNLSTDIIIYDIRLHDLRLFKPDDIRANYDKILDVKMFYIFVINDVRFKPRLLDSDKFKYRRILEKELFEPYIKELRRTHKVYTIHYWRFGDEKKNLETTNLVISFEKEKSVRILSTFALTMNIIVALIFSFSDTFFKIEEFYPIILIMMLTLALILFLPPFIVRQYNNLWVSKVNRNN